MAPNDFFETFEGEDLPLDPGKEHKYKRSNGDMRKIVRRRPNRWGKDAKFGISPTMKVENLSDRQIALYAIHIRVEEIGRVLRTNDFIPRSPDRSPSPEPMYGADGKRINTREFRYRKRLEDERHRLVSHAMRLDVAYKAPSDYRRPSKISEKVPIPVKDYPDINFIGLILGPRGSTLKTMEAESEAKIAIRGKGSVKEGKGAPTSYQNQEEDLHCLITADSEDKIKKAVSLIYRVIEIGSTVPEEHNDLKRQQLRDLAALNGTLRDDENQACQICGKTGHKRFTCPEKNNITNSIFCRICNSMGHMARDCKAKDNPEALQEAREREHKMDNEYSALMAEIGAKNDEPKPYIVPQSVPLVQPIHQFQTEIEYDADYSQQYWSALLESWPEGAEMTAEQYAEYCQSYYESAQQYMYQQKKE